jgi:hypothetical protein
MTPDMLGVCYHGKVSGEGPPELGCTRDRELLRNHGTSQKRAATRPHRVRKRSRHGYGNGVGQVFRHPDGTRTPDETAFWLDQY